MVRETGTVTFICLEQNVEGHIVSSVLQASEIAKTGGCDIAVDISGIDMIGDIEGLESAA